MAEDEQSQYVTRRELDLRLKNIEQISTRIEATVEKVAADLKEFKAVLNPAFSTAKQQLEDHLANHIKQERQDKQRRKERWSSFQIAILVILATATGGMFIVALFSYLR